MKRKDRPLIAAAQENDIETAKTAIASGADVDSSSSDGYTALHWFSQHDNLPAVAFLIDAGATCDISDIDGNTPIRLALWYGHEDVAFRIAESAADLRQSLDGSTLLHASAASGSKRFVDKLLKSCGDLVNKRDRSGRTPIHWAVQEGHVAVVEQLIRAGADVDAADEDQFTPLSVAAGEGHIEIVDLLINARASVNLSAHGASPLAKAVAWEHIDVVRKLLSAGADTSRLEICGKNLLQYALDFGNEEIAELLREASD